MMNKPLSLFYSFLKIGLFTLGGGYAMIPLIQREVVDKGWVDKDEFLQLLTLAQSAPGPIALNTAVFVGYRADRNRGMFCAVTGIVIPSFVIILLIAMFFTTIRSNPTVEAVFKGIRPAVVALILAPVFGFSKGLGWRKAGLAIVAAVAVWYFAFSPVYLIIAGALGGIAYGMRRRRTLAERTGDTDDSGKPDASDPKE